jgi:hypothetical protein
MTIAIKLFIDFAMTILMLFALSYRITGDKAHEWIGISVCALFVLHNIINRKWWTALFKGQYNFRRSLNTIVNLALLLAVIILSVCGILHSRTVFAFMKFSGGMLLRQAHTIAAYWFLILASIHIGLHSDIIMKGIRKMFHINGSNLIRTIILRSAAIISAIYGIKSSFERDIGSKLFLGYSFDSWSGDKPAIFFFIANISIMSIYILLSYYSLKLSERKTNKI